MFYIYNYIFIVKYLGTNSLANCDYLEYINYEYDMLIGVNSKVYNNNKNLTKFQLNITFNSNFDTNIYYISLFFYRIYEKIINKFNNIIRYL